MEQIIKPIGRKAYGSIGHLTCSRMGPGDHKVQPGMERICTIKPRDRHDRIIVQEKLDGSCCAVALKDGVLHPLGRAGWPAVSSPYLQHRLFHDWVRTHEDQFRAVLTEGERIVGEWLAQAHSTIYKLWHQPFVPFDIMVGDQRHNYDIFVDRLQDDFWTLPMLLGTVPMLPDNALAVAQMANHHSAIDPIEGVVYRVERHGKVDFLAKYVRPDKQDGIYLPEISGQEPVWNWRPQNSSA
jgi:hypothetical protein